MRASNYYPLACLLAVASAPASANIDIVFDYTYDSSGFFSSERRDVMESVASVFEARITDTLAAITPTGGETFTLNFHNPSSSDSNNRISLNRNIGENEYRIYLGAYSMANTTLGSGGPGGFSASLFDPDTISRGQSGYTPFDPPANDTDFAPWGGAISFNNSRSDWDSDSSNGIAGYDFYSVAVHEVSHVLGFGTAASWNNLIVGTCSPGPCSVNGHTLYDKAHWAEGTMSTINGVGSFEAAMDPTLMNNTRKNMTDLDWEGLAALGWNVAAAPVPEPETWAMLLAGLGLVGFAAKRRKD